MFISSSNRQLYHLHIWEKKNRKKSSNRDSFDVKVRCQTYWSFELRYGRETFPNSLKFIHIKAFKKKGKKTKLFSRYI